MNTLHLNVLIKKIKCDYLNLAPCEIKLFNKTSSQIISEIYENYYEFNC